MIGEIFGGIGSMIGGAMTADAVKDATKMQIKALEEQRKFVYRELEPSRIGAQALAADVERAKNRLALQAITDPGLLMARYAAQAKMVEQLGAPSPADVVARQAATEALAPAPGIAAMKQKLIDAALAEVEAGATLPSDVQAELMRAGLERTGGVTGTAGAQGLGGQMLRQMVGERALALRAERLQRAAALTTTAQNLEAQRANLLAQLFPALKNVQVQSMQIPAVALQATSAELPQAGLSGESIANIWLARVGATNQLAQAAAEAAAQGRVAQQAALNQIIGGAAQLGGAGASGLTQAITGGSIW